MPSRGIFAQLHVDIAKDVAAMQAMLLDTIAKDFFEPDEPESDWAALMREIHAAETDPVKKALVDNKLRLMLPQLIQQATQQVQEAQQ